MRKIASVIAIASLVVANGGSPEAMPQTASGPSAPPVAAWPKPFLLPIKLPPTGSSRDWTQLSVVGGKGLVGGSPEAVSSIGQPLVGVVGPSRVVDVCKKALWDQASQAGAETIEAVAEDRDRRTRDGQTFAPVTMRLSYAKRNMFEVKKSTAICVVDRAGRFIDFYAPDPAYLAAAKPSKPTASRWSRLSLGPSRPNR